MPGDEDLIKNVIAKYGTTLDLQKRPHELIDVLRNFKFDDSPDGGSLPGGVPEPPPGPTSMQFENVRLEEVMAQILQLSRDVAKSAKDIKKIKGRLAPAVNTPAAGTPEG